MQELQKTSGSYMGEVIDYTPPRLHEGKEWYIDFYAYDPAQREKRRKKIKLNFIQKVGDRRRYANTLIKRLHNKLEQGWNPWIESENSKAYHLFDDVCQHYRRHIDKLKEDGILRYDTHRDYNSQLRNIEEWNKHKEESITYIYQFDKVFITDFLEEIYIGRKNSAHTRNNYLTFIRIYCSFLLEKNYVTTNPSDGVPFLNKSKLSKIRTIITENDILRLCSFLERENKHYLLACYILHYCFVRPKEMSFIKISDISISKQTLFVPGDHSKNRNSATVTIPADVIHLMIDLGVFNNPPEYYLFSEKFKPGKDHKYSKQFTDYWALTIRKKLNFPKEYQFYSLKDTGITEMLRKYDVITVRDQARHSDIQITNKYTPHDTDRANPLITNHKGTF